MLSVLIANSPWLIASVSLSTQQQTQSFGLPLWLWLVVALFIIAIGVIWTLYEEGMFGKKRAGMEPPSTSLTRSSVVSSTPASKSSATDNAAAASADQAVSVAVSDTKAESVVAAADVAPPESVSVSEVSAASEESTGTAADFVEAAAPVPPARPDNLKRVRGIGPKIEQLLKARGIMTFAQLADTEVSRIQAILDEADYKLADPESWPAQARQFAEG